MKTHPSCLRRSPTVHVITFSGAHGTGKSTLIGDLEVDLHKCGISTQTVPSCSREWCKRNGITSYDDINRLGRRTEMQMALPGILDSLLFEKLKDVSQNTTAVLCDRWISDIMAYSAVELPPSEYDKVYDCADVAYNSIIYGLKEIAFSRGLNMFLTHVFIPLSSCSHKLLLGETEGKVRATGDHKEWEEKYNEIKSRHCNSDRTLAITAQDRPGRVGQVESWLAHLNRYGSDA